MHPYMSKLPVEIQQHIYDNVPEYTRLGRKTYVGKEAFLKKCSANVTKSELIKYLKNFKVDNFIIYYALDTEFIVDVFDLMPEVGWNPVKFIHYRQTRCIMRLVEVDVGILQIEYRASVIHEYMGLIR